MGKVLVFVPRKSKEKFVESLEPPIPHMESMGELEAALAELKQAYTPEELADMFLEDDTEEE